MQPAEDLSCQELTEVITEYLEGTLSTAERLRFEAHLEQCPGCRAYLEQMRQTIRLTGKLTEAAVEPPARQALLDAFRDWKRGS